MTWFEIIAIILIVANICWNLGDTLVLWSKRKLIASQDQYISALEVENTKLLAALAPLHPSHPAYRTVDEVILDMMDCKTCQGPRHPNHFAYHPTHVHN